MNINRQPAGQPTGGQFAESARAGAGIALDPHDQPLDFSDTNEIIEDGDFQDVRMYTFTRDEDGSVRASADLQHGSLRHLIGAETKDPAVVDEHLSTGHVAAALDYLGARYPDIDFDFYATPNEGEELDLEVSVHKTFEHVPTQREVHDALWEDTARFLNEHDPGTFGSPFVGTALVEHLDNQAILGDPTVPFVISEEPPPTREEAAKYAADMLHSPAIEDRSVDELMVQRMAIALQERDATYRRLATSGYANRKSLRDLGDSALLEGPDEKTMARAIAAWAERQPTFSELMDTIPDEER